MNEEAVRNIVEISKQTVEAVKRVIITGEDNDGQAESIVLDEGQTLQSMHGLQERADKRSKTPRRRTGTARHQELDSFIRHVQRFMSNDSTVWACIESTRLVAVLNYHPLTGTGAAWCDHVSIYDATLTDSWNTWTSASGRWQTQTAFAEFLEMCEVDILDEEGYPGPLDMIEMASDLRVNTKGTFQKTFDKRTGTHTLVNKEERGEGSTEIPKAFMVALQIFEGGPRYKLEARVRLKLSDGSPYLSFVLLHSKDRFREAFAEVRELVTEKTKLPVFAGTPESGG